MPFLISSGFAHLSASVTLSAASEGVSEAHEVVLRDSKFSSMYFLTFVVISSGVTVMPRMNKT